MIQSSRCRSESRNWPGLLTRLNERTKPAVRWSVQSWRLLNPRLQNHETPQRGHTGRELGVEFAKKALKSRPPAQAKWITSPQIERSLCVRKLLPHAGCWARGVRVSGCVLWFADGARRQKERDLTDCRKAELRGSNLKECLKQRRSS